MKLRTDRREIHKIGEDDNGEWLLCGGVKSLLKSDAAEVVTAIARYVISQHRILRRSVSIIERTSRTPIPSVIALLSGITRFLEVRRASHSDGALWVARLENERHALENLPALMPEINWSELKFRRIPDAAGISSLIRTLLPNARRILKIARRLYRRHEFFKVFRAAELISYYTRYLDVFRTGRYNLAVASSHSSPHGIAFNLAARRCGVPTVLITHGMPVRPVAKLSYNLVVVNCVAARQIYLEAGWRTGQVIVHGRRQNYAPMPGASPPEKSAVGIFLCKDVNEERLRALVECLLDDSRVRQISVRPHPKNLWRGLDQWIALRGDTRLRRSDGKSTFADIKACDIVLGGNSSVLIEAVTAGVRALTLRILITARRICTISSSVV
jgi:hypothetical protein